MSKNILFILFILFIYSLVVPSVAIAGERPTKKRPEDVSTTIPRASKATVASWRPTAFDLNLDRLPPNYYGLDPVKFLEMFKSKMVNLKKGEFETSAEFAQRANSSDASISPINTVDAYAFVIDNIKFKYDADSEKYLIGRQPQYSCQGTRFIEKGYDWVTCMVATVSRFTDTYIGISAYGASRVVDRTYRRDFALAIATKSVALGAAFTQGLYVMHEWSFHDSLPVPLERARELKDAKLAVLFVGHVAEAKIIKGRGILTEAKFDSPTELFVEEDAVPFELKKIIYYVVKTGEVLGFKAL